MKGQLRIAVYHNLPSGGAKRTVFETVSRLRQDHVVDVFCLSTADMSFCDVRPFANRTVVVPFRRVDTFRRPFGRLNHAARLVNLSNMERISRGVAATIDRGGYDVVLVNPCLMTQAPSILRFLHTPSVYFCHEILRGVHDPIIKRPYHRLAPHRLFLDRVDPFRLLYRRLLSRIDRANVRSAVRVLTNSSYTRGVISAHYGVDAVVNRLGVDASVFHPLGEPREQFVISVGALTPQKGFDFLIASVATIPRPNRPRVVVVSNAEIPDERLYLRQLAEELQVEVDFFLGIPTDDLVRLYNTASLMAYAPVREPLGLASIEAQACETSVVGVDEGGVRETILPGQTGALVPRDPSRFGDEIHGLLASPARREELGRRGRRWIEDSWTWETSVDQLQDVLIGAANGTRIPVRPSKAETTTTG